MKHLLLTTIAAVVLVGCGPSAPDISIHDAAGAFGRKVNIEAVKQHLDAGTDVEARDNYSRTPLYYAVEKGHKKMVELLIARGANVNAKSNGSTPLDLAIVWKKPKTAALLRKHGGTTGAELKAEGK